MEERKEFILTQKQSELKLESCAFSAYVIPITSVLSCHFFLHLVFYFTSVTSTIQCRYKCQSNAEERGDAVGKLGLKSQDLSSSPGSITNVLCEWSSLTFLDLIFSFI